MILENGENVEQVRGIVTLQLLNKDTLEVETEREEHNTVAWVSFAKALYAGAYMGPAGQGAFNTTSYSLTPPNISNTNGGFFTNGLVIGIADAKITPDLTCVYVIPLATFRLKASAVISPWTYHYVSPGSFYMERKDRFDVPATNRTINTVFLSNCLDSGSTTIPGSGSYAIPDAYVGLTTPCTQTTTQVLDIIYRLHFTYSATSVPSITSGSSVTKIRPDSLMQDEYFRYMIDRDVNSYPHREQVFYTPYVPTEGQYVNLGENNSDSFTLIYGGTAGFLRNKHTMTVARTSQIGSLAGMYSVCGAGAGALKRSIFAFKAIPDDFANKPIQPLFNHNDAAPTPFLNVDYLASSQGSINVYNNGWQQDGASADLWRIDISDSGDVGTSGYFLRKRKTVGFTGANYTTRTQNIPWVSGEVDTFVRTYYGKNNEFGNIEEYSQGKHNVFGWRKDGINLFNMATGNSVILDNIALPALAVSNIYQVACDEVGNVWVADKVSGLFKITTPLSSPVATQIHSSPCYGVDVGYGDRVWTVSDLGLQYSDNYGSSWTTVSFTWIGITNSLWNNVRFVRADRSDSQHNIVIVYNNPSDSNATDQRMYAIWNNPAGTVSNAGGPFYRLAYSSGLQTGFPRTGKLKCSRYGSFWAVVNNHNALMSQAQVLQLIPGSTPDRLFIGSTIYDHFPSNGNVCFVYDKYNNPYTLATGGGLTPYANNYNGTQQIPSYMYAGLYSKDEERGIVGLVGTPMFVCAYPSTTSPVITPIDPVITFEKNLDGTLFSFNRPNLQASDIHPPVLQTALDGTGRNDHLGGRNSLTSEILWNTYGWNGSNWSSSYLAPISNIGQLGGTSMKRRFNPGNYDFSGMSSLSNSISSSSSSLTIACSVKSEPKVSFTASRENTLITLNSPTKQVQITSHGINSPGAGEYNNISVDNNNGGVSSSLTRVITHDSTENRYVFTGTPQAVKKSYGVGSFKKINGGKTFAVNYSSGDNTQPVSLTLELTCSTRIQDGAMSMVYSFPDYNNGSYYDTPQHTGGSVFRNFGVSSISPVIPELAVNNFDVEFIRRNVSSAWVNDIFTDGRFSLMTNFSLTPSTAVQGTSYARITTSATQKYLNVSFRYNHLAAAVSPGVIGAPRLFYCNGSSAESFITFTQVNPPVANDFNGINKTIVEHRYDTATQRFTVNVVSEDAQTKARTTIWTASPVVTFTSLTPGIVSVHHSDIKFSAWNSGVITSNAIGGVEISGLSITNFHDFTTLTPVTVSGTSFDVFRNGSLIGTLTSDLDASTITDVVIGNKSTNSDSGFKGSIKNIQLWDVAWNGTDVANDAANPSGKISSQPASNCLVHLPMVASLIGTEVKATHTTQEPMPDNLQIKFTNGLIPGAFVATDHFTVGVYDGIFKDDATSYDQSYLTHTRPVKSGMTAIENQTTPNTTSAVIIAATPVTELITWYHTNGTTYGRGQICDAGGTNWTLGVYGLQSASGDCSASFSLGTDKPVVMFGLSNSSPIAYGYTNINYAIYLSTVSNVTTIDVYENGTRKGVSYGTWAIDDVFTITRTGTTVTYLKNGTPFYTSLVASTGSLFPRMTQAGSAILYNTTFTYTPPYPTMYLGNSTTQDGIFNKYSYATDDSYVKVSIDSVEVPVVKYSYPLVYPTVYPVPAIGSCVFVGASGVLYFNPADIGKVVTAEYSTIYFK